ncbi:Aste57867_4521 [Aphanomyces stellatus]|uniref:Aste57867_4521 protein n=1 Tax=Aphanomyces stellatus TaxID=120398 RepID=A0A485KCY5_9STRA|nr:hypothetical protein As57867_004508 [Aphanomyces stellatus]VFT81631.1 Aste57867_4521 [Aphanomyces stellatus]
MIYRLYGANIGRRCYVGVLDIPEFDCVHIGDDCAFNATSFPQTHLFEDRVMKLGHVHVGNRCTMRLNATLLPQSTMEDDTALGCNSVAMKGEHLTSGYDWYGFPVDIRKASTKVVCGGGDLEHGVAISKEKWTDETVVYDVNRRQDWRMLNQRGMNWV